MTIEARQTLPRRIQEQYSDAAVEFVEGKVYVEMQGMTDSEAVAIIAICEQHGVPWGAVGIPGYAEEARAKTRPENNAEP